MSILSSIFHPMQRIAVALAALALAACSAEVVDNNPGGGFRPRPPAVCTAEYLPVCAARGGEQQTFANACEARTSGFRVVNQGECRHGRPEQRPDRGQACTREYAPVCGTRGRDRQTFANACEARSNGFDIVGRGECAAARPDRDRDRGEWREGDRDRPSRGREDRVSDRDRPRNDQRACTMEYRPVCAARGRERQTFGNACSADVAGFRVVQQGACPTR